jgi:hypothetical protein
MSAKGYPTVGAPSLQVDEVQAEQLYDAASSRQSFRYP